MTNPKEYTYVKSSNIMGVMYDKETHDLFVQFKNGAEYKYNNVAEDDYDALISSPSAGSYFNDNIKDVYSYSRI